VHEFGEVDVSADAYEQGYMTGSGAMLHREKVGVPRWAVALTLGFTVGLPVLCGVIASVVLGIAAVVADQPLLTILILGPLICSVAYAGVMTPLMLAFSGGRIAVSEGELHVQIGPSGPRIPIDDIASCTLGPSGTNKYGMGVGKALDGTTTYRMFGDNARAVLLTRKSGQRIVIACPNADKVVEAVQRAQALRALSRTRAGEAVESEKLDDRSEKASAVRDV